jgi:hypothetical protein
VYQDVRVWNYASLSVATLSLVVYIDRQRFAAYWWSCNHSVCLLQPSDLTLRAGQHLRIAVCFKLLALGCVRCMQYHG